MAVTMKYHGLGIFYFLKVLEARRLSLRYQLVWVLVKAAFPGCTATFSPCAHKAWPWYMLTERRSTLVSSSKNNSSIDQDAMLTTSTNLKYFLTTNRESCWRLKPQHVCGRHIQTIIPSFHSTASPLTETGNKVDPLYFIYLFYQI